MQEHTETAIRLAAALVCSGVLGWERERSKRPAGLRTHMMVGLGSAAFTILAFDLIGQINENPDYQGLDPTRIVAAIIGGVGFLGAGAIIQSRGEITGLTTAASVWVAAAIGMSSGAGMYVLTGMVAALGLLTLWGLRFVAANVDGTTKSEDSD